MIKRAWYFTKLFLVPHLGLLIFTLFTGLLAAAVSGLGIPLLVEYVFPVVFEGVEALDPKLAALCPWLKEMDSASILILACCLPPLLFVLRGLGMFLNAVAVNVLGVRILESMRMKVFSHLQKLPVAYLEGNRKGDLISRILADTQTAQTTITHIANDLVKQPITCLTATCAFLYLLLSKGEGFVFLLNMGLIALAAWPVIIFGKRISNKAKLAQAGLGEVNAVVQQNLETMREVRAYAMEERQIDDFRGAAENYCRQSVKMVKYNRAIIPVLEIIMAIALAVLIVRGRMCGMGYETFIAIALALYLTFDSMKRAGLAFNRMNSAQGVMIRLMEVLEEPVAIQDPAEPKALPSPLRGEITFRNVSFAYTEDKVVLKDVDLTIPAGQIVGLVGPSGAGKTTFASLIPRFYEVTKGAILVDGVDIRDVTQHDLREQIALVAQQALLFSGSIRENISLGRPGATEEQITHAADAAAVSSFLDAQSNGLDTVLGQGGQGLSGGQRQRVAIARAFIKDAPILILDEATASLDAESEREIQESLDSLAKGRTTLIVAHRFSTLRNADRLLVFNQGHIVGDGTHAELYETCPLYKDLYDRQGL